MENIVFRKYQDNKFTLLESTADPDTLDLLVRSSCVSNSNMAPATDRLL